MNEPLDTGPIQQRLRDLVPGLTGTVGGAAEYGAIKSLRDYRPGSAFVVLATERNPNPLNSNAGDRRRGVAQALCTFGVIVVSRNARGRTGDEVLQEMRPLIGAVRTALIGWVPEKPLQPIAWQQGDVMEYDANTLMWLDVFTTTHYLGGAQ